MAAKQQILFHLFMATVAVNVLLETTVAEHRPEHDGHPSEDHHHNHNAASNNTSDVERKFSWPSSVGITIHREGKLDGPAGEPIGLNGPSNNHPVGPTNYTGDGERKIHWPSSATLTIHRSGQVDSNGAQQTGPNAPRNDTDGERKIHWPSSMSITINRAGQAQHIPEGYKLDQEERLYGSIPVLVSCNHTTQAGRTCADCTHSLLCFSNNLGLKRDCGSLFCTDGRCSPQPSEACNATSTD